MELLGLGYADYYVFFASDYNELRRKMEMPESYCDQNLLELSTEKSKMTIFHKGNINYKKYRFMYKKRKLEIVKSFSYLGIGLSALGVYNAHSERVKSSANLAAAATVGLIKANRVGSWETVGLLFNSMV